MQFCICYMHHGTPLQCLGTLSQYLGRSAVSHLDGSLPAFQRLCLHVDLFRKGSYEKWTGNVVVCRSVETIEQRGTLPQNPESHVRREKEVLPRILVLVRSSIHFIRSLNSSAAHAGIQTRNLPITSQAFYQQLSYPGSPNSITFFLLLLKIHHV